MCIFHRAQRAPLNERVELTAQWRDGIRERPEPPEGAETVLCTVCGTCVPLWFSASGKRCAPCQARSAHEGDVARRYGLLPGQYEKLFAAQGGRCAICGNRPGRKRLAVDHDHVTGEVRGLLCYRENKLVLGGAKDSLTILRRAVAYLENPPARTVLAE